MGLQADDSYASSELIAPQTQIHRATPTIRMVIADSMRLRRDQVRIYISIAFRTKEAGPGRMDSTYLKRGCDVAPRDHRGASRERFLCPDTLFHYFPNRHHGRGEIVRSGVYKSTRLQSKITRGYREMVRPGKFLITVAVWMRITYAPSPEF